MVWQPRHEDIIGTFLFFLITGFAVFQIMIGYRRTRGLSFYGSAVRPIVNYVMGGILLVGGFAWYFSNPANRNVPGIEGFMSLVCMALGIAAAALFTALLPSLAAWFRRRRAATGMPNAELIRLYRGEEGELAVTGPPPAGGEPLTVLVCDVDGARRVARRVAGGLTSRGRTVAVVAPAFFCAGEGGGESGICEALPSLLDKVKEWTGATETELDLVGIGLAAELVSRLPASGTGWRVRRVFMLNPQPEGGSAPGALESITPGDILDIAWRERIWASPRLKRIWGTTALVALLCAIGGMATTLTLGVRWWPVSGTLAGVLISLWCSYLYLAWRRPDLLKGGYEGIRASVRAEMQQRPYPQTAIPRYTHFSTRLADPQAVSELAERLERSE